MRHACCPKNRAQAPSGPSVLQAGYASPQQVPQQQQITRGVQRMAPGMAVHKTFTYHELHYASAGFSTDSVVGEGGFGNVYKGQLPDGTLIAIKRLDRCGLQGDLEFNVEVSTMLQLQHPNIVPLLGSCCEQDHRIAVFQYMPHGNLRDLLDGANPVAKHFNWPARLNVLLGVAKALAYLHEVATPSVIHRDLKTSNILIDAQGQARICDFGLARCKSPSDRGQAQPLPPGAVITGTPGYMPPEYAASGEVSEKSDVYAFGVVVLEVMTGMQAVDSCRPPGCQALPLLLQPALQAVHLMSGNLDPALRRHSPLPAPTLAALCEVAQACLQELPANRPHASRLVTYLQSLLKFMDSAPSLRQPVPSSAAAPHTQPHQRTLQATAAHIHNHISQQKQHQQHQQGQQHQPPGQQHQQPQQQQHSQHRHYHHPAHSVPDLDMSTAHYSPLKAATAQLRSSAGYGYELAIPGPSRNLSPLAHGLRSASLSCLPEVLAGAIAGAHEEEPCDNVGTHLGPLSQTQPAQAPFHPMHQRSRTCDTTQVVGRGCLDTQHQQHSPRHRLSHSQDSGPSHGHSHSLDCRHNNMYNSGGFERQSAYGHAGVGVFGQQQQSRGLSALAASLQDLPLAGTSQVDSPQQPSQPSLIMTRPGQGTTARDLRDSAWSMPGAPSTPAEAPELSAPSAPMLPLSPEGSYSVLPLSHLEATARSAASEGTSSLPNAESCTVQITFNTVLNRHRDTCEAAHSTYSPSQRYPVIRHVVPAQAAAGPHTSVEQRLECPSSSSHHPGCAGNDQFRPDCFDTAWQASPTGKAHRPTQSAFAQPHVTQQDPMGHVHHMRSESAPQDQSLRQLAYARQLNSPLKAPGGFAAALPSFGQPAQPAAMLQQPPVPETSHAHLQLELQQYPSWEQQLHSQPDSQDLWQQQQQQLHPQWHAHTQSQQQQWQQHLSPVEAARDMRHIQTKAGRSLSTALDRAAGSVSVPAAKPSAMQAADIELAPLRNGLIRAWPSPCKLQPPEVTAGSWHHFLSSCDALNSSLPPEAQAPVRHQQPLLQASARVGVCLVCLDASRDWQMVPCGHAAACQSCAEQLRQHSLPCPVCRSPVTGLRFHQFQHTYVGSPARAVDGIAKHRPTQSCV